MAWRAGAAILHISHGQGRLTKSTVRRSPGVMVALSIALCGVAVALCDAACKASDVRRASPLLDDELSTVYDPELVQLDQVQMISLTNLLHREGRAPNKTLQVADLRYISLVDASTHSAWRDVDTVSSSVKGMQLDTRLLFFARRASRDCPRGMWHTMCQRLTTDQWVLMHPVGSNTTLGVMRHPQVADSVLATNMDMVLVAKPHGQAVMYGAGGTYYAKDDTLGFSTYSRNRQRARDGISLLLAQHLSEVLNGSWLPRGDSSTTPKRRDFARPKRILDGRQPGCVEVFKTYSPYCNFDGKIAMVRFQKRYLVYVRANTVYTGGGRFLQVVSSEGDDPAGPYGAFTFISISGYDVRGPGNLYYASVRKHPLAPQSMLLGLFPLNEGTLQKNGVPEDDEGMPRPSPDPDCKGTCYIALSHSCDGIHWSPLVKLVTTTGDRGRTFDHPVSGFVRSGSVVQLYIHRDVPGISPWAPTASRLVRYSLRVTRLRQLMLRARAEIEGCSPDGFESAWRGLRWNSSFGRLRNATKAVPVRPVRPSVRGHAFTRAAK